MHSLLASIADEEIRGAGLACLAFIRRCDAEGSHPDLVAEPFALRHHDCERWGCGPAMVSYETENSILDFCARTGRIHNCGDDARCCYATVTPDLDGSVCFLTGRSLSRFVMPASESQWDDRLDRKRLTQLGTESGDSKHAGNTAKRKSPSTTNQWPFGDLVLNGPRFPALAKPTGEELVRESMRAVCSRLFESTVAAKLSGKLGEARAEVPFATLANASDVACRLRLLVIHSKPYETCNQYLSAEKLCMAVLYGYMRKTKNDLPFYSVTKDEFVDKAIPSVLDVPTFNIHCTSGGRTIAIPDINRTKGMIERCIAYWRELIASNSIPATKLWTPFTL